MQVCSTNVDNMYACTHVHAIYIAGTCATVKMKWLFYTNCRVIVVANSTVFAGHENELLQHSLSIYVILNSCIVVHFGTQYFNYCTTVAIRVTGDLHFYLSFSLTLSPTPYGVIIVMVSP